MPAFKPLTPTSPQLFFSRKDQHDLRLGDLSESCNITDLSAVEKIKNSDASVFLMGYPDDEGIALNKGRIGAHQAPERIRHFLYKMTSPFLSPARLIEDLGSISLDQKLMDRHQQGRRIVHQFLSTDTAKKQTAKVKVASTKKAKASTSKKRLFISLGGGHDYGYADGAGFLQTFKDSKLKPVIINLDAHLDVRPCDESDGRTLTSGTPFYRLLNEFKGAFHFYEIGIQKYCTSLHHLKWAEAQKAKIFLKTEDEDFARPLSLIKKDWSRLKGHPCFFSLDIDCMALHLAPGCSQSWPQGLELSHLYQLLKMAFEIFDVKNMGIYEVSPQLDVADQTSKLAASVIYYAISQIRNKAQK